MGCRLRQQWRQMETAVTPEVVTGTDWQSRMSQPATAVSKGGLGRRIELSLQTATSIHGGQGKTTGEGQGGKEGPGGPHHVKSTVNDYVGQNQHRDKSPQEKAMGLEGSVTPLHPKGRMQGRGHERECPWKGCLIGCQPRVPKEPL